MSDPRLTVMLKACAEWEVYAGAPSTNASLCEVLLAALDAHVTPSAPPAEGVRVRIVVAFDGNDQPYICKIGGGDVEGAWNKLEDWYSAIHRTAVISATIPLPKIAEIEGAVETEAG